MFVRPNKTNKATPNDNVMTNPNTAKIIIEHFKPNGLCLDPCVGDGAFYNNMPMPKLKLDISEGTDFLKYDGKVDWIISNPPFSIYDLFLLKAFEVSDNIVWFTVLNKVFKNNKIEKEVEKYGGLKEIVIMGSGARHGFPFGFQVGCIYYKRNYCGDIKLTRMNGELVPK